MDSLDLMHFPILDPPNKLDKKKDHDKIQSQVDEYLKKGGEISTHDSKEYKRHSASLTQKQMRKIKRKTFRYGLNNS